MEQKEREVIIFLAGEIRNEKNIRRLISNGEHDYYAADAGYLYAQKFKLPLKRVLGDFDSTNVPQEENLLIFPSEKDQTDSELALDFAIRDGYRKVWMVAPFGGRLDHTIANIALLEKAKKHGIDLMLYDGENLAFLLQKGLHHIADNYRYISFFPLNKSARISLIDFKYPLKKRTIQRMFPLAISNEPGANPTIRVHRGSIICVCIEQEAT